MDTRASRFLDLYTTYLLASCGHATATGLSAVVPEVSHDQVTRFLSRRTFGDKDLWQVVKPMVRRFQSEDAVLILDDTVEEKPYTDASELICWHFDHTVGRPVKGVNLLSALYVSQGVSLPVAFHLIQKTAIAIDPKTGDLITDAKSGDYKWQSPVTKNEIARQMVASVIQKQIPVRYVLADSWFSATENLLFIKGKARIDFVIPLKSNRNVFLLDPAAKAGKPTKLDAVDFGGEGICILYLEKLPFPVLVLRQVFTNEDGSSTHAYLSTSDTTLSASNLREIYQKRWKIEEFHKSLKSNASFAKSPTKKVRTQSNHFFASIAAFVKLEACRIAQGGNHFAISTKIYISAMKISMSLFQKLVLASPGATITA